MRIFVVFLLLSSFADLQAQTPLQIDCQAIISPEKSYAVELDFVDRYLRIKDEGGFIAQGNTSYAFSPAAKTHRFLLGVSLSSSVQLDVESEGKGRVSLCLRKDECYPCL